MNRLLPSAICGVCGKDMRLAWRMATTAYARADLAREIENGMCDEDQRKRQAAAIEYERASCEIATLAVMGAVPDTRPTGTWVGQQSRGGRMLGIARRRLVDADARCVELKMWTAVRPVR